MILFISHGAPSVAIEDDDFTRDVARFGKQLDDVRALVVISAHWQSRGVRVNAVERPETVYDFGGFSPELYQIKYEAPGDPPLAQHVSTLLGGTLETSRGWDHGVWVPISRLLPDARIPIVEVSLPHSATPAQLLEIGSKLAILRDENIVITGSGGIVHNLSRVNLGDKFAAPEPWAQEFDAWFAARLEERDFAAIADYRARAPHAGLAVPTPEHFEPVLVALGAVRDSDRLETIHASFHYGSLSMRTFTMH